MSDVMSRKDFLKSLGGGLALAAVCLKFGPMPVMAGVSDNYSTGNAEVYIADPYNHTLQKRAQVVIENNVVRFKEAQSDATPVDAMAAWVD